jgi:hypothetical protein
VLGDAKMIEEQCKDDTGAMSETIKAAERVVQDGRAQKLCAIVMALLKTNDADKGGLNDKIKAEVQEARSNQIKEDCVLPKCIHDKMLRTLGGR